MIISICDDCYKRNECLSKGEYIKTYAKEGEVYNLYHCENCGSEYEEQQSS